ncbi:MAG TPA: PAS domain S-box protein [Spirochaetota bacterium]|nr:PAS domain S-box protein [Spirochaetota bacterium]
MAFKLFDANKQLAASEIKQQAMISNISDIICIIDAYGIVKYISSNIEKWFGWQPDDLIGSNAGIMFHPEGLEYLQKGFYSLLEKDNSTKTVEAIYKCKDGSSRPIKITGTNLVNEPVINGVLLNYHDISDRRQTEKALKESEANYRQLYENSPAGIYRVDFSNGKFVKANDVFLGYLGYSQDEITSLSPYDILTENSKKLFIERVKKMALGEEVSDTVEYEILDKDGKLRYVQLINKMIYNAEGRVVASDVVAHEITERKLMEIALKESERKIRTILGNVPGMVYRCSNNCGWTMDYISEGAFYLTGYHPDGLLNNSFIAYAGLIHEDDQPYVWNKIQDAISRNGDWEIEYRILAADNIEKWVLERGRIVGIDSDGKEILEGFITDITGRKQSEESLRNKSALFESLLNSSIDGILIVDNRGKKIVQNNRTVELWKIPQHIADIDDDRMQVNHVMHMSKAPEQFVEKIEYLYNHQDETSRDEIELIDGTVLDRYSAPVLDSDGICYGRIWLFHDITENKRSGEQIRRREEKYRSIFENIQDCYYEVSIEGTIIEISPSIEIISNGQYSRNDLIGTSMDDLYNNINDRDAFLSVIMERESVVDFEIFLKNKDGHSFPCTISSKLYYDAHGSPVKIIGSIRNISERKSAENKIQSLLNEKELILKEVHHRIKNNMNTIYGVLALHKEKLNDPVSIAALEDAGSRIQSMMVLYDKLYRSSDFIEISVATYLSPLVDEIVGNFPNSDAVRIEKNIDDFVLDVKRLQSLGIIINELLTNIMKYAFTGRSGGLIIFSASLKGTAVSFIIQDNGNGIPESIDFKNSNGFGLMLVEMLIRQIGGKITIERIAGTKFILEFEL